MEEIARCNSAMSLLYGQDHYSKQRVCDSIIAGEQTAEAHKLWCMRLRKRLGFHESTTETDLDAEDAWVETMRDLASHGIAFFRDCTPSYRDTEGDHDNPDSLLSARYGGGTVQFFELLENWRSTGASEGVALE